MRIISFFWLTGKIISWRLWTTDRLFPLVPPFDFLRISSPAHLLLFIASLTGLALLFLFPAKKIFQITVIAVEILSCLFDQNRWQPWEYEYIFIITAFIFNPGNDERALKTILFILISTYFYSGLGKMNRIFSEMLLQDITHTDIKDALHTYWYHLITYHIGYLLGSMEVCFAMGLVFKKTQKIAAGLLIIMHALIIISFSPLVFDYDAIILPWNAAFALVLYYFFLHKQRLSFSLDFLHRKSNWLIFLLFGLLPVLNFFGYWDNFLSANLFSYKKPIMMIYLKKQANACTPAIALFNYATGQNRIVINVRSWAFREMHVPEYPEMRVFKKIKSQLTQRYPDMDADYVVSVYENGKRITILLK